jgi:hypothetical protein
MTTFEALVSMSQTLLRARGEWHGPATSHEDIDCAVNGIADLMQNGSRQLCEMAVSELKQRSGYLAS